MILYNFDNRLMDRLDGGSSSGAPKICPTCNPLKFNWEIQGSNFDQMCMLCKDKAYELIIAHNKLKFLV